MENKDIKQEIKLMEQDLCQAISNNDADSVELYEEEIFNLKLGLRLNGKQRHKV